MSDRGAGEEPRRFPPNAVHAVRTAQQVHVALSQMADQKANMLLAATFLIFTIAIGQARNTAEPLPILILGAGAFFSAVLSIMAVMPATHFKTGGRLNILFFGSFERLSEEEYLETMLREIQSEEGFLTIMARDLYQNGVVLARKKYRLLGYAYQIFLVGLCLSFLAFVLSYFVDLPQFT
ncbi:MAG TPA: Pycsar system effector family protein [Allosphingosinicella sp.]